MEGTSKIFLGPLNMLKIHSENMTHLTVKIAPKLGKLRNYDQNLETSRTDNTKTQCPQSLKAEA